MIEQGMALNSPSKHRFRKLVNAAEKAFADRAILLDQRWQHQDRVGPQPDSVQKSLNL
jgi:hypothetical protein